MPSIIKKRPFPKKKPYTFVSKYIVAFSPALVKFDLGIFKGEKYAKNTKKYENHVKATVYTI